MTDTLYTIGHSNRGEFEFLELLLEHGVELLADIRAFPGSRRQPQFGKDALAATMQKNMIAYQHLRDLGGRRRSDSDGRGSGCGDAWRNSSFRAYAEYAQSDSYDDAIKRLADLMCEYRVCVMCSEAVPWRCHRWLVSDTMFALGNDVLHIVGAGSPRRHQLSPFAVVEGAHVTWPGPVSDQSLKLGPPVSAS